MAALATSPDAHAIEDGRFVLRAGGLNVEADSEVRGRTTFEGEDYEFDEDFDFGSDELVPRLDGELRLGQRSRLVFNYFDYGKTQRSTLDEAISFDEVGVPITLPAGSFAESDIDFRVAGLAYDFAVVENDTFSLGLQLGVQHAKLEGSIYAQAGTESYRDSGDESGTLPVLGARMTFAPSEQWRISVQAQGFDTDWGDFDSDTEGSVTRALAVVEYRFNENFGIHAGYDYFRINAYDEGGDGLIGLDQRFRGPMAGITVAF